MTIIKRFSDDGTAIFKQSGTATVTTSGANKAFNVTVTDAKHILEVLDVKVSLSPATTTDQFAGISWAKNVVGMTLASLGAGSTVTVTVTVIAI
jgi:hypothetical protein